MLLRACGEKQGDPEAFVISDMHSQVSGPDDLRPAVEPFHLSDHRKVGDEFGSPIVRPTPRTSRSLFSPINRPSGSANAARLSAARR